MRTTQVFQSILFAVLVAGCPDGSIAGGDSGRDGARDVVGQTCNMPSDCPGSAPCVNHRCAMTDGGGLDAPTSDAPATDATGTDAPSIDGGDAVACALAHGTPAPLPVDIIVMVDQSASTGEEAAAIQANINTNLGNVLSASGLDYRVILINSNTSNLCPGAPLGDPAHCDQNNPPRYYRILHPVNNSDELTLLLWTYDGASKQPNSCHRHPGMVPAWRDYLRFESLKIFIVFSDDDPTTYNRTPTLPSCPGRPTGGTYAGCSNADCLSTTGTSLNCGTLCPNFGCPTFADRPADWGGGDFPTELYALQPQRMVRGHMENPFGSAANPRWVFHSLIGVNAMLEPSAPITNRCATCDVGGNTSENAGVTYQALSRLTGGLRFSSCDTDYSPVFRRISSSLAPIACEFRLESTGIGTIDPATTNVVYYAAGMGSGVIIPQDASAACDYGANGWQFVGGNTRIRICGPLCDAIQADPAARVEIQQGCATTYSDGGGIPINPLGDGGADARRDSGTQPDGGHCVPEICGNGVDDDCDGLVDYQDLDCIAIPP